MPDVIHSLQNNVLEGFKDSPAVGKDVCLISFQSLPPPPGENGDFAFPEENMQQLHSLCASAVKEFRNMGDAFLFGACSVSPPSRPVAPLSRPLPGALMRSMPAVSRRATPGLRCAYRRTCCRSGAALPGFCATWASGTASTAQSSPLAPRSTGRRRSPSSGCSPRSPPSWASPSK